MSVTIARDIDKSRVVAVPVDKILEYIDALEIEVYEKILDQEQPIELELFYSNAVLFPIPEVKPSRKQDKDIWREIKRELQYSCYTTIKNNCNKPKTYCLKK